MKCSTCGKMDCYEHGGELSNPRERGVHHQREGKPAGESNMGTMVRRGDAEMAKRQAIDKKKDQRNISGPWRPLEGLAHGGEVEDQGMDDHDDMGDMSGVDDELMDMAAGELLDAIHSKDKKQILESIKAIVLSCQE